MSSPQPSRLEIISDPLLAGLEEEACTLAAELLTAARAARTPVEQSEARKMTRLLNDPSGKELTFHLADEVFRPPTPKAQARVFRHLIAQHGIPNYLKFHQRFLMRLGALASRFLPGIVMPSVTAQIRRDSQRVILSREEEQLDRYFHSRNKVNLNLLGEAILGEEEAERRLQENLTLLAKPECTYLSVKISAIFSQINLLDEEGTLAAIQERLRKLYRTGKFINLDMEEYRDLHLTCEAFRRTLDEEEFADLEAGIVLQAYLPDSYRYLKELTGWAKTRKAPIKIRIVKGANLAMEKVEASLHDWPQAPYSEKVDVDANFKRMLLHASRPENAKAARIGVASHNLFDIAFALLLRKKQGTEDFVELEMLEGMSNDQARIIAEKNSSVLFYSPIVRDKDFHSAIAYLVRRLDENTSPGNFLPHVFSMTPGDAQWQEQERRFLDSCQHITSVSATPNRNQNRALSGAPFGSAFRNSPDTDWTLSANRQWLTREIQEFQIDTPPPCPELSKVLATAKSSDWAETSPAERAFLLYRVADQLENARGRLIAVMRHEAEKRPFEADVEVSEAVDFANYYGKQISVEGFLDGTSPTPLGPIVITPPWNFPCAIPCGGILAALAAGNPVIIKPAPETILTAWEMVKCLWQGGIPEDALQFFPCPDNEIGQGLITSPDVRGVILTGASETADLFKSWRSDLPLFAETSGKNALIITATADSDLAIKDLVHSAFGHAGQKCSAASLALIESSLYDSPRFLDQLRDAAASLPVGPADDPAAFVTPLIREPGSHLLRGLTQLDEGESWLLEPRQLGPTLWSPGIRLGVKPNSWIHRTELFGPVLSIIRIADLEEGLRIQNSSDFGLTGGIHSLDPEEISHWREHVEVGNAYINRAITGAIVQRQPFGGWKRSSVGPGAKAGGPNYLTQFSHWEENSLPEHQSEPPAEVQKLLGSLPNDPRFLAAARSYAYWWEHEFSREHEFAPLLGQSNHFRYRPATEVVCADPSPMMQLAAATVGAKIVPKSDHPLAKTLTHTPLANGRLELLHYLHEQSISETTHRHGRVSRKPQSP
ncbi:bifunctional proline dehydrogenase/L-glutamate gamma-semialdehyde dehydrogenase [Akkermansiaceae bacterium]|nr:bifunctional proline dehydrogenase/L-glutamate gamma-semialdehyde dehydrogenase [Akkermansiaceae bacterium]